LIDIYLKKKAKEKKQGKNSKGGNKEINMKTIGTV
jgi:hypothetical protein